MKGRAYIDYSIKQTDAHMVYEIGDLLREQGYEIMYSYEHPDHPKTGHAFEEIALSLFYVGIVTAPGKNWKYVMQHWQYAKSQGITAMLLVEKNIAIPSQIARDPNVLQFDRFMPANPIRFIMLGIGRL